MLPEYMVWNHIRQEHGKGGQHVKATSRVDSVEVADQLKNNRQLAVNYSYTIPKATLSMVFPRPNAPSIQMKRYCDQKLQCSFVQMTKLHNTQTSYNQS